MTQKVLAIESATDWLSIALLEDEKIVLLRESSETRQHASALMPLVHEGLAEAGWGVGTIDSLAVSAGPGSFTSLRIGLATAKGLSFGRDWQAVGVSTLEAMALGAFESQGTPNSVEVIALLDARRGEWYAGGWSAPSAPGGTDLSAGLPEGLYDPASIAIERKASLVLCSPERAGWIDGFEAAGIEIAGRVEGVDARPRADRVGRLGYAALARGEGIPADELAARYLRRAEAEAKRLGGPVEAGELARVQDAQD